jgi:bacterioferritin-associated ferredoxin
MDKATIVCRCEEITVADIENAVLQGAETFDDVKRLTRCGMGACQAKTCHTVANAVIAELTHRSVADVGVPRFRIPLRPITMDILRKA